MSKISTLGTCRWNGRALAVSFSDSKLCVSEMTRNCVEAVAELGPDMTRNIKIVGKMFGALNDQQDAWVDDFSSKRR